MVPLTMPEPNWADKTIWTGDCLDIMRGMNAETVDLIYLDPPFNSNANYAAPIGSQAAGAAFKDTWSLSDVDAEWINLIEAKHPQLHRVLLAAMSDSDKSYLAYMAARVLEMPRILKPTGSIYLHCDPTMSHYLKLLMDAVFGPKRFLNEVVWHYRTFHGNVRRYYARKHDILLMYTKSSDWVFNRQWEDDNTGTIDFQRWRDYLVDGRYILAKNMPVQDTRFTRYLRRWRREHGRDPEPSEVVYEVQGQALDTVWDIKPVDPKDTNERLGYPTQKPLALLHRIINASSNPADIVLDPFCGCATACVAADLLDRRWIGIDVSPKAAELVNRRLREPPPLGIGAMFHQRYVTVRDDIPQRTDLGPLPAAPTHRRTLYGIHAGDCAGCGEHFQLRHLEVDHIIARARGGTDHIGNLQLLCGSCNRIKGDRGMEYLRVKLQLH